MVTGVFGRGCVSMDTRSITSVYRVMRNEGLLLFRQVNKPLDTRKHDGKVAVKESDTRWCSDGLELSCDNGERVRVAFALDCCDKRSHALGSHNKRH